MEEAYTFGSTMFSSWSTFASQDHNENYRILPFFQDHMIEGIKRKDFEDWSRVAELIRSKAHLTEDGVEKIR